MRTTIISILAGFILFASCDNPWGNIEFGLLGNWWLSVFSFKQIEGGNIVFELDSTYNSAEESQGCFSFSCDSATFYATNGEDTYLVSKKAYVANAGLLIFTDEDGEKDTNNYEIEDNCLFLNSELSSGDTTQIFNETYEKFKGPVPPLGWPPIVSGTRRSTVKNAFDKEFLNEIGVFEVIKK